MKDQLKNHILSLGIQSPIAGLTEAIAEYAWDMLTNPVVSYGYIHKQGQASYSEVGLLEALEAAYEPFLKLINCRYFTVHRFIKKSGCEYLIHLTCMPPDENKYMN